ncbi:OLC1v1019948C3 [Oldenlandia corymbosa var. corymbosa]|uniref:DNA-directed RNA polymerase III subunit RPC9 n=1 Tax=Oldenlandia corymbosa var. corymbosa TaxID=529605 RepID=A0AAV1EFA8_OLDCO|nr:OLC1v1019948C3 [Oldenlandia corymbosa var. corymbosa]
MQVYDYLEQTAASVQTRDIVNKFINECKSYDLAPAEILNIINIRPASEVEVYTIIEDCENRSGIDTEKLVETVVQVLPAPPTEMEHDEGAAANEEEAVANEEETADKDQNEVTA